MFPATYLRRGACAVIVSQPKNVDWVRYVDCYHDKINISWLSLRYIWEARRRQRKFGGRVSRWTFEFDVSAYRAVITGRRALCQDGTVSGGPTTTCQHEEALLEDRQHVEGAKQLYRQGIRCGSTHRHRRGSSRGG